MSAPERLVTVVLLTLALLAVPVMMWRHGVLGPSPAALLAAREGRGQPQGVPAGGLSAPRTGFAPGDAADSVGDPAGDTAEAGVVRAADPDGGAPAPYEGAGTGTGVAGPVVHVAGAVRHPGVYRLPGGARVVDALRAAGGERDDAAAWILNLAARVVDGDRIYVPTAEEVAGAGGGSNWRAGPAGESSRAAGPGGPGGMAAAWPVDINHASAEELDTVPGIGPALAQRIVAFRKANGPFARVEDLTRVPGIGPKTLEAMKGWLVAR